MTPLIAMLKERAEALSETEISVRELMLAQHCWNAATHAIAEWIIKTAPRDKHGTALKLAEHMRREFLEGDYPKEDKP